MSDMLGNRIREERERLGWTQASLAERVGVSRKTVNTIENQVFTPSATLALKIARAFDRQVEDIFWLVEDDR